MATPQAWGKEAMITASASELIRVSDCSSCNGYGWIYVKYSGRYDKDGNYLHDWTPCKECNEEGER